MVIATALSADADYLVSGDKELQGLKQYDDVQIVSPVTILAILDDVPSTEPALYPGRIS